jgi:hypothetical protein
MIGGVDISISGRNSSGEAHVIVECLRKDWPDAIVSDADDRVSKRADEISAPVLDSLKEFFVYRSHADMAEWKDSMGTIDSMIHVIMGPVSTTIVGDHDGTPAHRRRLSEVVRAILDLRATSRAPVSSERVRVLRGGR